MKNFRRFFRNGKFHVQRDAYRRNVDGKIAAFLSSVVYYFGDLLKSANMSFVRYKTFISLLFDCLLSLSLIIGDFKVTCCALVDIQAPVCDNFGFKRR